MAKISVLQAEKNIKAGNIQPVYFLSGKETYFHDRLIKSLKSRLFSDAGSRDLNMNIFYGTENSLGEMISACMAYPMLADRRLVIVKNFNKMKISDPDSLEKYVSKPISSTVLILSAEESGKTKIFQTLKNKSETISCDPIPEYKLNDWIFSFYNAKNIHIDRQASQFLVNHIGSDLLIIENEIEKILNYKNNDTTITIDDLIQTTGASKQANIFTLQNALGGNQLGLSLKISKSLIESGENISGINAILFAFYRKVMIVSSLKVLGKNHRQITEETKLGDFQLKNIFPIAERYSPKQIGKIIQLLKNLDMDIKTSNISEKHALNMLCYNICNIK